MKIDIKIPRQIKNFFPLDIFKTFLGKKANIPKNKYKTPKIIIPLKKAETLVKRDIKPIVTLKIRNTME
jgi:hypothetical protein